MGFSWRRDTAQKDSPEWRREEREGGLALLWGTHPSVHSKNSHAKRHSWYRFERDGMQGRMQQDLVKNRFLSADFSDCIATRCQAVCITVAHSINPLPLLQGDAAQ